jgi:endoglucanase
VIGLVLTTMMAGAPSLAADPPSPAGNVVFQADFETSAALSAWSGPIRLEAGCRSTGALALEANPAAGKPASVVSVVLPVERVRGCLVRGTAMVRAEGVGAPPNPWNGIKCMLALATPDRKLWPQATIGTGTFDWRRVAFTTRVPADATSATLALGLEQVAGKVWFDDVKIVVARPARARSAVTTFNPPFTNRDGPRMRGAMVSPNIDAEGLRVLGRDWNANLIRWQLIRHGRPGEAVSMDDYDAWLEGELKKLDAALPRCEEHGLRVVVDLHSPPGGRATVSGYVGSDDRLFSDPACQQHFVTVWQRIAVRYQASRPVWGFDLANEPVEDLVEEGCDDWQGLAERAARAIRAIDPRRTIIVEPAAWGGPDGLADLVPLPLSNVVYSVHMYLPHAFTHQGVHGSGPAWRYPGVIEGKSWDKAQIEAALRPVIDFQRAHGVPIYIGEFSAIRWAPDDSALRYLEDLITIFEEHRWDWSYHAFREWSGWSVEHGSDRAVTIPATSPTGRQRLLRRWFALNQKPAR